MTYSKGLEGVIAGETAISNVEGEIGRLTYRGYAIEELVELPYMDVVWLVIFGDLPAAEEAADIAAYFSAHGSLSEADLRLLKAIPTGTHPMKMLQALVPVLSLTPGYEFDGLDEEASRGLQIVARLPTLVAAYRQLQLGQPVPAFDSYQPYLKGFLTMFTGQAPSAAQVQLLRTVQILQMEHSFNAGTFTTRVAGSTLASVEAVMAAGIGALSGVLHGGADEAALNDAKTVGNPAGASEFIDDLLLNGGKLMGMGHREYRTVDPRSVILKPLAEQQCMGTDQENLYLTLVALEDAFAARMASKGKAVKANLEFYKGAVYESLGIPADYFTAVFAMSRMVGWLAHFIEARSDNRIVRPAARYVGQPIRSVS